MPIEPPENNTEYNSLTNYYTSSEIEIVTPPYDTGYLTGPGQIFAFPFAVAANTRVIFNIMHTRTYREDFSLACWFSSGLKVPVLTYPNDTYYISLQRANRAFCLQDINYSGSMATPTHDTYTILVEPGDYYFQVQNRVNAVNKFEFVQQIVQLT